MEILKTAGGNITRCRIWKLQKLVAEISLSTEYENHENHVDIWRVAGGNVAPS